MTTSAFTRRPSVVLSYGLGVDSTAILLRWILEPESRDFDLDDLVVITAMTGNEWAQTGVDVETHILPLLREHGVRYIQVARSAARANKRTGEGVTVLDDSTAPTRVFLEGVYRLSDEMLDNGTIPQSGGKRACSMHSKGEVLDPVIDRLTEGLPFRHAIGFEANEPSRACKDVTYNTEVRNGWYPLIEWGWDRETCEAYIKQVTGVDWEKSACTFCPFALSNKTGRARVFAKYAESPEVGAETLMMEHAALALNPRQGLIGGKRAVDVVREAGHDEVIRQFEKSLENAEHALYEVRRVIRGQANAARSVQRLDTGSRAEMLDLLEGVALDDLEVGEDGIARVYLKRRGESFPTSEQFLVVAPATAKDKQEVHFERWWAEQEAREAQALVLV